MHSVCARVPCIAAVSTKISYKIAQACVADVLLDRRELLDPSLREMFGCLT